MMSRRGQSGYSLIELMITISIIGILSTIAIPSYKSFADKARYARSKSEMIGMSTYLTGIRMSEDKTLYQLIVEASGGNTCIACTEGRVVGSDANAATNLNDPQVLAAWNFLGYGRVPIDAWGRPYFIDQNEYEFGPTDCRHDIIYSAGANSIVESDAIGDDINGDDVGYRVPFYAENCKTLSTVPDGFTSW